VLHPKFIIVQGYSSYCMVTIYYFGDRLMLYSRVLNQKRSRIFAVRISLSDSPFIGGIMAFRSTYLRQMG
jgi:hypothetical protein